MTLPPSQQEQAQNNQALVTKESQAFGVQTVERSSELASVAVAESARAEVESSYVMAMRNPRHEETARTKILASCRNPGFAVKARFRKPMGNKEINGQWVAQFVVGPSIRFAEEMLRCWKNVLIQQTAIYDDQIKRIVRITTRDLESNTAYSKEISIDKSIERKSKKDRDVLGQRLNSYNEVVYIVRATEDELNIKESALASKIIRNNGLRLIPQHIQDEAMAEVEKVIRDKTAKDPEGERRAILDGFSKRGVTPLEIERYMGGPSAQFSGDDLLRLREMLTSIEDGHSTWQEFLEGTPSQTTEDISEKSQVETKGKEVNEKLKSVAQERGVETVAQSEHPAATAGKAAEAEGKRQAQESTHGSLQTTQESSKPAEQGNIEASTIVERTEAEQLHHEALQPSDAEKKALENFQAAKTPAPPTQELPIDSPEWIAAQDIILKRILAAEIKLKETPAGTKKMNTVLSVMKIRLTGSQKPLDVMPREQRGFYLAQLDRAIASTTK